MGAQATAGFCSECDVPGDLDGRGFGARLVLAGHPVTVGGRDGHVLVATPAQ